MLPIGESSLMNIMERAICSRRQKTLNRVYINSAKMLVCGLSNLY